MECSGGICDARLTRIVYVRHRTYSGRPRITNSVPVKVMKGRSPESVCILIPDDKEPDRGFHDVILVDMLDADAPVAPVADLNILRRQWPLSILSGMSRLAER